jgi:uncharacterized protein
MRLPWFSKLKYLLTRKSSLCELTIRAEQGDALAQNLLGDIYATDKPREAIHWYRKAADQGDPSAQGRLGMMYAVGKAVQQDDKQAYIWLYLATPNLAGELQDMAAKIRDEVAAMLTPEQIADAQRLAREWRPVQQGNQKL